MALSQAAQRSGHVTVPTQDEELPPLASFGSLWGRTLLLSTAILSAVIAFFFSSASVTALSSETHSLQWHMHSDHLLSNGTHDFGRTVVLVSIDGLRPDYLTRGFTPHLTDISREGIRAEYMKPIFPGSSKIFMWHCITGRVLRF
ncbi:hypothetical protein PAXRUDRAFT_760799 [Paxillus rubicundulus Ve08.2h10]|uniref:Uncharacterized protein n=1 Tax=Paxillus rubicundulus Ve08.2h10 TaxID=930991 RepID=A0A0D0EBK5_9AGAM|nr:hypothetical protein PAXRUDRAFT_760799 [Paxillus rubicundulus Ve08.2h10]